MWRSELRLLFEKVSRKVLGYDDRIFQSPNVFCWDFIHLISVICCSLFQAPPINVNYLMSPIYRITQVRPLRHSIFTKWPSLRLFLFWCIDVSSAWLRLEKGKCRAMNSSGLWTSWYISFNKALVVILAQPGRNLRLSQFSGGATKILGENSANSPKVVELDLLMSSWVKMQVDEVCPTHHGDILEGRRGPFQDMIGAIRRLYSRRQFRVV